MHISIDACNSLHPKVEWFEFRFSLHFDERQHEPADCGIYVERNSVGLADLGDFWDIVDHSIRILRCRADHHYSLRGNCAFEMLE